MGFRPSDIEGKKAADGLAMAEDNEPSVGPEPFIGITYAEFSGRLYRFFIFWKAEHCTQGTTRKMEPGRWELNFLPGIAVRVVVEMGSRRAVQRCIKRGRVRHKNIW